MIAVVVLVAKKYDDNYLEFFVNAFNLYPTQTLTNAPVVLVLVEAISSVRTPSVATSVAVLSVIALM